MRTPTPSDSSRSVTGSGPPPSPGPTLPGASSSTVSARDPGGSGKTPLAVRVDLAPEETERRLELTLQPGLQIQGRVTTSGSEALAGPVTVRAQRRDTEETAEARAQVDGSFQLAPLPPGRYVLWAHGAHPFDRSEYVHAEAGDADVELVIDLATSLAGTVVDGVTGELADAHVHLISARGSLGMGTGLEGVGTFRFAGLDAGVYSLTAGTDDGRFALLGDVPLAKGESRADLVLELQPGATLAIALTGELASARCAIYAQGCAHRRLHAAPRGRRDRARARGAGAAAAVHRGGRGRARGRGGARAGAGARGEGKRSRSTCADDDTEPGSPPIESAIP